MENGIKFGDIVQALCGRDDGRYFIVTGISDALYLYIADGKTRSAENPKKKKIKHVKFIRNPEPRELALIETKVTNSNLRKILAGFHSEI